MLIYCNMYVNCLILKTMTMSDFYQLVRNRVEKFNNISEGFRTKKIKNKIEIIIIYITNGSGSFIQI
mgnify:CR=1 FL=1